jgi:hypothetical protein
MGYDGEQGTYLKQFVHGWGMHMFQHLNQVLHYHDNHYLRTDAGIIRIELS